ncbi:MAG: ParA family protein [Elainellaceae cyanobacterium]
MLKIAIWNMKGGTGKSTTTLNLGAALAKLKHRTLTIDLDGQRTLSYGLGLDGSEPTALGWLTEGPTEPLDTGIKGLGLIPGDIGMFRLTADHDLFGPSLKGVKGYEVCLMDCPPSLGYPSVQAILSSDRVLLPTLCEPAALKGLTEAVALIQGEKRMPIDVLRVRYKPRLVLTREADERLTAGEALGYRLLASSIPENITVAESIAHQVPVSKYDSKSSGSQAYQALAEECCQIWGLGR